MIPVFNTLNRLNKLNITGKLHPIPFSAAAQAYFTAMTEQLPSATKEVINAWIVGLDEAGILATPDDLDGLDFLRLHLPTEQASLLNVNQLFPQYNCTKVNNPTYSVKGWTGNSNNYINTNYTPYNGNTALKLTSAIIGTYLSNQVTVLSAKYIMQAEGQELAIGSYTNGATALRINSSGGVVISYKREFIWGKRSTATLLEYWFNKLKASFNDKNVTAIPIDSIRVAASEHRQVLEFCGSHLTDAQMNIFQDLTLPVLEFLGSDYWSNYEPATPTLTINSNTSITIGVTLPVTTYSPYTLTNTIIEHSTDGVNWSVLTTLDGVTNSYEHDGLDNNSLHYYRCKQLSSRNINSSYSISANARTIEYVDYIRTNVAATAQYINTGIKCQTNDTIDIQASFILHGSGSYMFGARYTSYVGSLQKYIDGSGGIFWNTAQIITEENKYNEFDLNLTISSAVASAAGDFEYYVMGVNNNGTVNTNGGKILKKYIHTRNGIPLINLKPALNLTGQFCMFDEVSKTYKLNAGTGIFTGGGVTSSEIDALLIQYAADGVASVTIDFRGADNGTRSTASDSAVTTLMAAGCTILTNP